MDDIDFCPAANTPVPAMSSHQARQVVTPFAIQTMKIFNSTLIDL